MAAQQVEHSGGVAQVVLQVQEVLLPEVLVVALRQQRSLVDGGYLVEATRLLDVAQVLPPDVSGRFAVRPILLMH